MSQEFTQELERALPGYLLTRRWYGEKSKSIASLRWSSTGEIELGQSKLAMGIASIDLAGAATVDYAVPVVVESAARELPPICTLQVGPGSIFVYDAVEHEVFHDWLRGVLLGESENQPDKVGISWSRTRASDGLEQISSDSTVRLSSAEQSNNSLIIGDSVIVKLFRKLRAGQNPDVEIGRFLTNFGHFANVPATFGELRLTLPGDSSASLGVAQAFVRSIGDGWEYCRAELAAIVRTGSISAESMRLWLDEARELGSTTARLHLALAEGTADADFAPSTITDDDIARWTGDLQTQLTQVLDRLAQPHLVALLDPTMVDAVLHIAVRLSDVANYHRLLLDCSKTRIHGDFHLGQTLRTADGRWIILDFEGEPARTIEERRAKSSPLRDVAGMLRSFNYARGITAREIGQDSSSEMARWESGTREAYLDGYFGVARPGVARFLPKALDDARQALRAWELQKALYEVLYELDNRPSWAWLPLTATLKLA